MIKKTKEYMIERVSNDLKILASAIAKYTVHVNVTLLSSKPHREYLEASHALLCNTPPIISKSSSKIRNLSALKK